MKSVITTALILVMAGIAGWSQKMSLVQVATGANTSIRGMSLPLDNVIWVSGSNGTVGRSVNSGITWQWNTVAGFEKLDFRDIHAFDSSTAVIMAIDNPAYIFKTMDGGKTWKKTFEKKQEGMFLDAMDFAKDKEGICIGDPLAFSKGGAKFFYIIRTHDGGETWVEEPFQNVPPAQNNEAIFSASGTNISFLSDLNFAYAFVTGGAVSNLYFMAKPGKANKVVGIPINQGKASSGTFSMASNGRNKFYCIGGDYKEPKNQSDNFYYTLNSGKKWARASVALPFGYRSCIRIIDGKRLIACGTNGVDYTQDGGKTWLDVSKEGFNVCMVSPDKNTVYLAGEKGKIGRMKLK